MAYSKVARRVTNLENDYDRVMEEIKEIKMLLRRMNAKIDDMTENAQQSNFGVCDSSETRPREEQQMPLINKEITIDSKLIFIFN